MKRANLLIIVLSTVWALSSVFGYEATTKEEKHYKISSGGDITILADEGFIQVRSWDKNEVRVIMYKSARARTKREAEKRLKQIDLEIEHNDDRLSIREIKSYETNEFSFWDIFDPDRWGNLSSTTRIDFELTVPYESSLRLETDEGDITVNEVKGNLEIEVDEGNLELSDIEFSDIIITVDEGDVFCKNIKGADGRVNIETDEGRIRLEKAEMKKIRIDCDEGDIFLNRIVVEILDIDTDEGDIEIDMNVTPKGDCRIHTDEGDVEVLLPASTDITVRLETEDGRITNDFGIPIDEFGDGERARGTIGRGGAKLEIYSDEGRISLHER